ncbi:16S rRNA (uracil(1498)-N(3))-methyltransferase [Streptomyces thermocarboxydus]
MRFPEVADAATSKGLLRFSPKRSSRRCCTKAGPSRWLRLPCPAPGTSCWSSGPKAGCPRGAGALRERGARAYRLGKSVLRTSTAGTAAAALLLGRTGRWS